MGLSLEQHRERAKEYQASTRAAHEALDTAKAEHAAELAERDKAHAAEIAEQEKEHADIVRKLQAELAERGEAHSAEIDQQEKARADIVKRLRAEIAALKDGKAEPATA